MQRHDVASTLSRRCLNVMCPLGDLKLWDRNVSTTTSKNVPSDKTAHSESWVGPFLDSQGCKVFHVDNEAADKSARMCSLIWIFVGFTRHKVRFLMLRHIKYILSLGIAFPTRLPMLPAKPQVSLRICPKILLGNPQSVQRWLRSAYTCEQYDPWVIAGHSCIRICRKCCVAGLRGLIGCLSPLWSGGRMFDSCRVWQNSFVAIGHKFSFAVIFSLRLIQEGKFSGERLCTNTG